MDPSLGRCSEDGAAMVVDVDGDGGCVVVKFVGEAIRWRCSAMLIIKK